MKTVYDKLENYINGEYAQNPSAETDEEINALVKEVFSPRPPAVIQPSRVKDAICNQLHHFCIKNKLPKLLGMLLKNQDFVKVVNKTALDENLLGVIYNSFDEKNPRDTLLHQYCINGANGFLKTFISFFMNENEAAVKVFSKEIFTKPIEYVTRYSNVNLTGLNLPRRILVSNQQILNIKHYNASDLCFWLMSRGAGPEFLIGGFFDSALLITSHTDFSGDNLTKLIKKHSSYQAVSSAIIGLLAYNRHTEAIQWLHEINASDKHIIIETITQDETLKSKFNAAMAALIKQNKVDVVDKFVLSSSGWPVDTSRKEFSDILYYFVNQGCWETANLYLKKYNILNAHKEDNNNRKRLIFDLINTYKKHDFATLSTLLETIIKSDPSCLQLQDNTGRVPLDYMHDLTAKLCTLVSFANTDYLDKANYSAALLYKAKSRTLYAMKEILMANTPTDRKNSEGSYFLHLLIENDAVSASYLSELIDLSYPDLTSVNRMGQTPLQFAQLKLEKLEKAISALENDTLYQLLQNPDLSEQIKFLPKRKKLLKEHRQLLMSYRVEAQPLREKVAVLENAPADYKKPSAQIALFNSILSGRKDISHSLLTAGIPLNYQHAVEDSPLYQGGFLHAAAQANRPELIDEFLARGAELQLRTANNSLAIDIAANAGHWECVLALLPKDADIAANPNDYQNVLYQAIKQPGNLDIVNRLTTHGVQLIIPDAQVDAIPLLHTIVQQAEVAKLCLILPLIETDSIDFNSKYENKTAYELALELNNLPIIESFADFIQQHTDVIHSHIVKNNLNDIEKAINKNIPYSTVGLSQQTLLHALIITIVVAASQDAKDGESSWLACKKEQIIRIIHALCKKDELMPFRQNQSGQDAYALAKELDCDPAIQETLRDLQKKSPLSFVQQQPYPLHYAITHNLDLINIKLLLTEYQFDAKDGQGVTAIELAAQLNQWEYVNSLMPTSELTSCQQEILGNILPIALAKNQDATIGMLLKRGAIFSMDPIETSFLFKTIKAGNPQTLMMLLNFGNINKAQAQEAIPLVDSMIAYVTNQALSIVNDEKGKQEFVEASQEVENDIESDNNSQQVFYSAPRLADGLLNPVNLKKMRCMLETYCYPVQYTIAAEKIAASKAPDPSAKVRESELTRLKTEL